MRMRIAVVANILIAALCLSAHAAVPRLVPYQAYLTDGGGNPMAGPVDLDVRFYDDATAGNLLYSETHTAVPLVNGVFTVEIGSQSGFGVPDTAFDATEVWLSLAVNGGAELTPRVRIGMVPFAAKAQSAEQLVRPYTFAPAVVVQSNGDVEMVGALDVSGRGTFGDSIFVSSSSTVEIAHDSNTGMEIDPSAPTLKLEVDNTTGLTVDAFGRVGIGTETPVHRLQVEGQADETNRAVIQGRNTSPTNLRFGAEFLAASTSGRGVVGWATATTGSNYGVYGQSSSTSGLGVYGTAISTSGTNFGVRGRTNSSSGYAGYFEGGRNYFEGNVGIGKLAPNAKLDVESDSGIALSINQSGSASVGISANHTGSSGNAGNFSCSGASNTDTALLALHAGPGKAFLAYNYGTGKAAEVTVDNPANSEPALSVTTSGTGPAVQAVGLVESTTGGFKFPDGTIQTSAGGGFTLPFSQTVSNSGTLFSIVNSGTGSGISSRCTGSSGGPGFFQITSSSNDSNALVGTTFGSGKGVAGFSFGTGPAGYFEVNNAFSAAPAIHAKVTNGNGYAIKAEGAIQTDLLEITGGADLAEPFDVVGDEAAPGSVVVIDADRPGKLKLSNKAYDRTVAGVISGAGGVRPGMVMAQSGTIADGSHHIALTGRVYCLCDARSKPIRPGDLLTTSETPGHAMRVDDTTRAQGAILGKAMTALDEGRGLVLVLVSLQ
ncbi:MAG: hypothetical protein J5J06_10975 [Phycisphaerae bacterium]|nr:hypothetical protein [Phycisphaerae bacterium]